MAIPFRFRPFLYILGTLIALNAFLVLRIDVHEQGGTLSTPKYDSAKSTSLQPYRQGQAPPDHETQISTGYTTIHTCHIHNETITIPTAPYLIIIGAQKAGTTSMSQWLQQHPQVLQGRFPNRKESHFFQGVFNGLREERSQKKWNGTDEEFYCRARLRYAEVVFDVGTLLQGMNDQHRNPVITVDKTPAYIHLKDCPEYVARTCPWGVKILVLLRNPTDRAYSQHEMDIQSKKHNWPNFEDRLRKEVGRMRDYGFNAMPLLPENATVKQVEALEFPSLNATLEQEHKAFDKFANMPLLKKGLYAVQLREWLKWIPRTNMILLRYEDLKRDPDGTYRALQKQLGLQDFSLSEYAHFKTGSYRGPMKESTRLYLKRFFAPYNQQMAELFGTEWQGAWESR